MGNAGRVVGTASPRPDSEPKVRGSVRVSADRRRDDALHAKLVLAPYAHARIVGIDVNEAAAMTGVVAVMTARDVGIPAGGAGRLAEPLARDEVVFAGQPVALVIASSPTVAADAVELVDVRLEPVAAVKTVREAMAAGSALVRADLGEASMAGEVEAGTAPPTSRCHRRTGRLARRESARRRSSAALRPLPTRWPLRPGGVLASSP